MGDLIPGMGLGRFTCLFFWKGKFGGNFSLFLVDFDGDREGSLGG